MARQSPYPPELRRRAVRMVTEVRPDHPSEWSAMKAVATELGVKHAETVRSRVRQAEVDAGARPGTTTEESAELKRLKRENAELPGRCGSAASSDQPHSGMSGRWGETQTDARGRVPWSF